jgi:hypothetical protein
MRCVEIGQLLDLAKNRVDAAVAETIRGHLADGCSRCQNNWAWVEKVIRLAASDDSVEPPRWVVNRAISLFEERGPKHQPGFVEKLVASLVFDTLAQPQMAGARRAGLATRQCLYRAGAFDIDLSFEAGQSSDTIDLTGQVLRKEGASDEISHLFDDVGHVQVCLLQQVREAVWITIQTASTNHLGEFNFEGVRRGAYDLKISLTNREVWVPGLDVKAEES